MKHLIIITGLPAAGKSTLVQTFVDKGYMVLSRDILGGSLSDADSYLDKMAGNGIEKIIMDATYLAKTDRANTIAIGKKNGFKVSSLFFLTKIEDAMVNAVSRMIQRHGKLFQLGDYKNCIDPNMFPVAALYRANKLIEKPSLEEGFDEIIPVPFVRKSNGYTNKAIIFDYDGTLRETISGNFYPTDPSDVRILPGRIEKLKQLEKEGYILLGVSNQSGVAKGILTESQAISCFEKTNELLGFKIDYSFCPHTVPPIICYCRKPGVGHGIEFIEKYKLDPTQCIMVGDLKTDNTFATRCGFQYKHADEFF